MARKRLPHGQQGSSGTATSAYPSEAEVDRAMRFVAGSISKRDVEYFSVRAEEHRRLGFESPEHRAANAHHLLASMYERLIKPGDTPGAPISPQIDIVSIEGTGERCEHE